jgi:hypothetical protein
MPENIGKPKQINGSEFVQKVPLGITTFNTSGSIHDLIRLETQGLRQRARRQITKSAKKYEAQPLGGLIKLAEERDKSLKQIQR